MLLPQEYSLVPTSVLFTYAFRVTLDKRTKYSSVNVVGERKTNILNRVLVIFSFPFFFSKAKSVISPSLTHHRMETADTLLLHYILTFSPH